MHEKKTDDKAPVSSPSVRNSLNSDINVLTTQSMPH